MFALKKVKIRNFKGFPSLDLEMPEITVLTGANSSGKSSFLHSVLGPLQSEGFPFFLSPNGKYVDMGDFIEMAHCRKREAKIEISFVIDSIGDQQGIFETSWVLDKRSSLPQLAYLKAQNNTSSFDITLERGSGKYLLNLEHDSDAYSKTVEYKSGLKFEPLFKDVMASLLKDINKKDTVVDPMSPKPIQGQRIAGLANARHLVSLFFPFTSLIGSIGNFGRNTNFISSFRLAPERTYYEHAKAAEIGPSGEHYIDQIIEWERQKSSSFKKLVKALTDLRLLNSLHCRRIRGGRYEISVKPGRGGISSALTDVGFGISQFLPIAVADIQLGVNSTLIIAQPEIHLHPSVQANLGNYFSERIKAEKKRYIIETHSEYLLNRLRLLIVNDNLKASNVAVYHFCRRGCETTVHPIKLLKNGKIEGAPQDFFETYMVDTLDIAMGAN